MIHGFPEYPDMMPSKCPSPGLRGPCAHPCPAPWSPHPRQGGILRLQQRNPRKYQSAPGWGRGWMRLGSESGEPGMLHPQRGPYRSPAPPGTLWPGLQPTAGAGGRAQVPRHLFSSVSVTSSSSRPDLHYLFEEYSGLFASFYR